MRGSYPRIPFIFEFHSVKESMPMKQFPAAAVKKSFVSGNAVMTHKSPDHLLIRKSGTSSPDPLASHHDVGPKSAIFLILFIT